MLSDPIKGAIHVHIRTLPQAIFAFGWNKGCTNLYSMARSWRRLLKPNARPWDVDALGCSAWSERSADEAERIFFDSETV